jgi:hypothetical protein
MVSTIKFSDFNNAGNLANNSITVGFGSGFNQYYNNPWTFLPSGGTAERPVPTPSMYYLLRFNTDLQVYEYYDAVTSTWTELSGNGTGTVNPGLEFGIAYYPANGTEISGLNPAANSVLVTNGSMVPSLSTTLPAGLTIPGYQPTITPQPLTEVNDTNITLTLGGTPASALLQAVSITAGWTGTLSLARGGLGAGLSASLGGIFYSTSSAGAILSGTATASLPLLSGSSAAPTWGLFPLSLGGALATAGALTTNGAFGVNFTFTNTTNVTFPTSGTLATTSSASGIVNSGLINQLAYYAASGNAVSGLATANSSVLVTSAGGIPSLSTTLPSGLTIPGPLMNQIFDSNGFMVLNLLANTGTPVNYIQIANSSAGGGPGFNAEGSDTNIAVLYNSKGLGQHQFYINNALTFVLGDTATPVNYVKLNGSTTGNNPVFSLQGTDPNIGLTYTSKGTAGFTFNDSNSQNIFVMTDVSSAANYISSSNAIASSPPNFSAKGTDTNIYLQLNGKGNLGAITQGSTSGTYAPAGYKGEIVTSNIPYASRVTVTSNTPSDITHINLTAGNWMIVGNVFLNNNTTLLSQGYGWCSTSSASTPDNSNLSGIIETPASFNTFGTPTPVLFLSASGSTTVYLSCIVTASAGTCSACGTITAMRI